MEAILEQAVECGSKTFSSLVQNIMMNMYADSLLKTCRSNWNNQQMSVLLMNSYWSLLVMFYQRYVAPDAPLATFLSSQFSKRGAAINVRQPEFIENHQTMVLDFRIQSWNSYFFWTGSWSKYVLPYRYVIFSYDKISVWLVVWNMNFIFPYIGNVIIPTDELHHFSEGLVQSPTR